MKRVMVLAFVLVGVVGFTGCEKAKLRKLSESVLGNYTRTVSGSVYSDSTTQVLLGNEDLLFYQDGDVTYMKPSGYFGPAVVYTAVKSSNVEYDLELIFDGLDYSYWLPSGAEPDHQVLDYTRYFVKVEEGSLVFAVVYPSSVERQEYVTQ